MSQEGTNRGYKHKTTFTAYNKEKRLTREQLLVHNYQVYFVEQYSSEANKNNSSQREALPDVPTGSFSVRFGSLTIAFLPLADG